MGWILDIEVTDGAIGITILTIFHCALGNTNHGIALTFGIWKLLTYVSLEWREV